MATRAAPSVRKASHDGASTDGPAAAPTAARARQRGHLRRLENGGSTGFVGKYLNIFLLIYHNTHKYVIYILRRSN